VSGDSSKPVRRDHPEEAPDHIEEDSMSRIKDLRASLDKKLDRLEHQALALEAQLTQTKDQALQRLEQRKQQLRDVLKLIQADVQKSKDIAGQAKAEVQVKLEHLQVQLALGKADARDTFEEQRTKILNALNEFESIADQKLKGAAFESGRVWEDLVGRASGLEAEFEALKSRFKSEHAGQQDTPESKKQELLARLQVFKSQLNEKRRAIQSKADTFEQDLHEGMDQIKTAFRRLFE
jgi:DNA repair exonuclease SbcCD ATPase subunit